MKLMGVRHLVCQPRVYERDGFQGHGALPHVKLLCHDNTEVCVWLRWNPSPGELCRQIEWVIGKGEEALLEDEQMQLLMFSGQVDGLPVAGVFLTRCDDWALHPDYKPKAE